MSKTMLNEQILEHVRNELPASELLRLRETCTLWNENFLPMVREHGLVELHTQGPPRLDTMMVHPASGVFINIDEFTKDMEKCKSIPFTGYQIYHVGIDDFVSLNKFIQVCGKTITRLDLALHVLNNAMIKKLREIVFEWALELQELSITLDNELPTTPEEKQLDEPFTKKSLNLTKLTVFVNDFIIRPYFRLIQDIIESAVGLEHLALEQNDFDDTLEKVNILSSVTNLARLKSLKIFGIKAQHVRILLEFGLRHQNKLQLSSLRMLVIYSDLEAQDAGDDEMEAHISRFLATQVGTLQNLQIHLEEDIQEDIDRISGLLVRVPRLNLRSITLPCDAAWHSPIVPEQGGFSASFPGLKHLRVNKWTIDDGDDEDHDYAAEEPKWEGVHLSQFAHEGVTSLELDIEEEDANKMQDPLPVSVFAQTWPSVTMLELKLEAKSLPKLEWFWTAWTRLSSLRIQLNWDSAMELDELLSGVPPSNFPALRQSLQGAPITEERLRVLRTQFKTQGGISDMEQLQEFVLDTSISTFTVSDIGGYIGFAMMPNQAVQQLALFSSGYRDEMGNLIKSESNQISEECRSFMQSVLGPCAVLDL